MQKKFRFAATTGLLLCLLCFFSCVAVAADGEGNGGGQNQDNPLTVVSTSPASGESNVGVKPTITLSFSKNVVNMAVKENNKNCFSLKNSQGEVVAIEVIFPDDQVEPDKKRIIYIKPKADLAPGVEYTLVVSDSISAKSGSKMTGNYSFSFKTKPVAEQPKETAPPATTSAKPQEEQAKPTAKPPTTQPVATKDTGTKTEQPKENKVDTSQPVATTDTTDTTDPISPTGQGENLQGNFNNNQNNLNNQNQLPPTENSMPKSPLPLSLMVLLGLGVLVIVGVVLAVFLKKRENK